MLGLLTNVKALQLFHILRQGGVILISILLAKSALTTAQIGAYEMLMYISFVLTFFWISGLTQGLLSFHPRLEVEDRKALVFNAYLLFSLISGLMFLILIFFKKQVLLLLTNQPELENYELFIIFLVLNVPAHLLENYYLLDNRPEKIAWFGIISFLLPVIAIVLPVYAGWGFYWSFAGLIAVGGIKHLWLLWYVLKQGRWIFRIDLVSRWAGLSFALILYSLAGGFNQAFDNWLVGFYFEGDEAVFAVFRYGARELPFVLAMAGAFGTALLPEVVRDLPLSLRMIREKSLKLLHLLFPLSIILVLTSKWLFPIVFSEAFSESAIIFNIYLLIIISRLIFSRTVLVGLGENRAVFIISLIELAVNVAVSLLLVRPFGLAGIAAGTLIAFSVDKALLCIYLYRKYGVGLHQYVDLKWYGGYSAALVGGFVVSLFI